MSQQPIKECIILAGNSVDSSFNVPKPMLSLGKLTLLEYQLRWLMLNRYNHIIIASDREYEVKDSFKDFIEWKIEPYGLGTGGAVLNAVDCLDGKDFYLMNIDDLCFYNCSDLTFPDAQARILVSKPKIAYGQVELRQNLVLGFKEKPYLDAYVSTGHYYFKKHIVDKYFPDIGSLESKVLPVLAKERILEAYRLRGNWVTISNNYDYGIAKEITGVTD